MVNMRVSSLILRALVHSYLVGQHRRRALAVHCLCLEFCWLLVVKPGGVWWMVAETVTYDRKLIDAILKNRTHLLQTPSCARAPEPVTGSETAAENTQVQGHYVGHRATQAGQP